MKIEYLGHSSFRLTESTGTTIVTDPYESAIGLEMPATEADAVTISHKHYDHNNVKAVKGNPVVLDKECSREIGGVHISSIKSYHDNAHGKERGENLIFKFRMDGIDVCHLGDLGEDCSSELIDLLLPVNVLLIPVGGTYTIDAAMAKEYVDRLMPEIVIPMHYKTKKHKLDIDKFESFTELFDEENVEYCTQPYLEILRDDIHEQDTKVIVMEQVEE
jgi:L-ascorbate metabolism protein UlaG (beta-lactamase superfamily)